MRTRDLAGRGESREAWYFDPRAIVVEKNHNPRNYSLPENRAHLNELKESIRENGVLQPLWVRNDGKQVVLVDGECRLRAVIELINEGCEIEAVPTIIVKGNNEVERLILALTANTGKPLSKWEVGAAYQRLINFGWTDEDIAKRMGQTPRYIREAIELSDSPEEVKQLLSQAAVTPSLALQQIRKNGSSAIMTLRVAAEQASSSGKTAKREKMPKTGITLRRAAELFIEEVDKELRGSEDFDYVSVSKTAVNRFRKLLA